MELILRSIVTCLFVTYALGLDFNFPEKEPCIMAQMNVDFKLSYKKEMSLLSNPLVNTTSSKCTDSGTTATLVLYWTDSKDTMTFTFMKGTKNVEMGVMYMFTPLAHFKDSNDSHLTVLVSPQKELSMSNMSYKCDSSQDISFNKSMYELVMTVANIRVQAFGVKNGTFSGSEDCSEDTLTTETQAPQTTAHHDLTTSPSPTTEPPQYKFRFPKGGDACILLNAAIQLDINYMDTKNNTRTAAVNIPNPDAKVVGVDGQCGNESTSITLSWRSVRLSTFSIRMNFTTTKEENEEAARLKTIEVTAVLYKEEYPELNGNSTKVMSKKNVDLFSSSKTTYYICRSRQEEKLDNTTTVVIYQIQVQAFGVKKSNFTGHGTDCSEDHTTEIPTTTGKTTNATALPTNTTTLPTNTTTLPTNTTTLPTNTTTSATTTLSTNATTHTTNATTSAATTSAPPGPHPTNTYSVRNGNVTCVYFKAGMDFTFPYMKNGTNASALVSVPANATADGTCDTQNETTNEMNINFYSWKLMFVFGPDNSSSQLGDRKFTTYSVKSITLYYQMDPTLFPGYVGNDTDEHNATASITTSLFQSKVNGSYKCNVDFEVPFSGNIKLETYNLQYKAFNQDNSTHFGGELSECSGDNSSDNKTNSVVPIAVGAALAGLVVIVLIAYLIGRRRNRKGYESV